MPNQADGPTAIGSSPESPVQMRSSVDLHSHNIAAFAAREELSKITNSLFELGSPKPGIIVDDSKTCSSDLDDIIASESIVVFGKSSCPFCTEVERTLNARGTADSTKWLYYRLDRMLHGAQMHAALKAKTGQATVPYVYVHGRLIGGCSDLKAAELSGALTGTLGPWTETGVAAAQHAPTRLPSTLFLFPNTVDARVIRVTGSLISVSTLLIAILAVVGSLQGPLHGAARWMSVGLFVDFVLRFTCGANASIIGAFAIALVGIGERVLGTKATFRAGPPKQFAQLVGVAFSGAGALLLMLALEHGNGLCWAGCAVLLGLAAAAGLEGFGNVCLGCIFFSWGVALGVFPKDVYCVNINETPDVAFTWADWNKRLNEGEPTVGTKMFPGRATGTKVDARWKEKTDDQRRESCGAVRHFHAMYWAMPLSLAALAYVFLLASRVEYVDAAAPVRVVVADAAWQALAVLAGAVWAVAAGLQAARAVRYPRKVAKEAACPVRANAFLFATICLLLLAVLAAEAGERGLAKALFWAAAPAQLAGSLYILTGWLYYLHDWEHVSPVWLAVPLSNVFSALAWSALYRRGAEGGLSTPLELTAGGLFLGFALLAFAALYPVAVYKALLGHNQDADARPAHWLLVAAPAVVAFGFLQLDAFGPAVFCLLYLGALVLAAALVYGIYPMRFYLSGKWSMGVWAVAFTVSALAACTIAFHRLAGSDSRLTEVMVYVGLAAAAYANWVCACHFVRDAATFKVFTSEKFVAPIMFLKLTHEGFRGLIPKVGLSLAGADLDNPATVHAFLRLWDDFTFLTRVHMLHEDGVIFPAADRWLPHHSAPFAAEHDEDERQTATIAPHVRALRHAMAVPTTSPMHAAFDESYAARMRSAAAAITALKPLVSEHLQWILGHLDHEELRLSPVLRKNLPLKLMREIVQQVWSVTDSADMFRFLPLVLNNIRRHPQRLALVRVLLWAMPERCKQVGVMLALGVDMVTWQRITDEVPDIIPRGMSGWRHFG